MGAIVACSVGGGSCVLQVVGEFLAGDLRVPGLVTGILGCVLPGGGR